MLIECRLANDEPIYVNTKKIAYVKPNDGALKLVGVCLTTRLGDDLYCIGLKPTFTKEGVTYDTLASLIRGEMVQL